MLRTLTPLLFTGVLLAADAAVEPLLDIVINDLARTETRFAAGPYGTSWNSPALAPVRTKLAQQLAEPEVAAAVPDWAILRAAYQAGMAGAALRVASRDGVVGTAVELRGSDLFNHLAGTEGLELDAWLEGGDNLRRVLGGIDPGRPASASGDDDLLLRWQVPAIATWVSSQVPDANVARVAGPLLLDLLPEGEIGCRLVDAGLRWETRLSAVPAGLITLDAQAWADVPATVTGVWAVGFDGAAWYQAHGPAIDAAFASADPEGTSRNMVDSALGAIGIMGGLEGVCSALRGTFVVATDAGLPFYGGVTIGLPSTPELDRIVQSLLGLAGMAPPGEGKLAFLGVNIPVPIARRITLGGIAVARKHGRWWLATDTLLLDDLLRAETPRYVTTAAGQALTAAAPGAQMIGVGDGRQFGRLAIIGAAVGGSFLGDGRHGDVLAQSALSLARTMGPTMVSGRPSAGGGFVLAGEGLDGGIAGLMPNNVGIGLPVIAAIAIPNLLESRITANEAAAASTLKSGYLPAEVVFQSGGYADDDSDGIGEYGFAAEMSGEPLATVPDGLQLLPATHRHAVPENNGYRFYVFLPAGEQAALSPGDPRLADSADLRERHFVIYAIPVSLDQGRRCFAITTSGTVYAQPAGRLPPGGVPTWNWLFGDNGWGNEPAAPWMPYRR